MKENPEKKQTVAPDFFLDITPEVCPMTFVKTKLRLESMAPGQVLEVRLTGPEPLHNVPRNARDHGHEVLVLEPEDPDGPGDGPHRLIIRRT